VQRDRLAAQRAGHNQILYQIAVATGVVIALF
jgi:hypothetical protein